MKIRYYCNSDDPNRDFTRRDKQEYEWLKSRPICSLCSEPIQEDIAYISLIDKYPKGLICEHCAKEIKGKHLQITYITD